MADAGFGQHQLNAFGGGAIAGNRAHLSAQRCPQLAWPNALINSADGIEARSGATSCGWSVRQDVNLHVSSFRG
jgi:hypothetical protein